jgi:hypothetical protein
MRATFAELGSSSFGCGSPDSDSDLVDDSVVFADSLLRLDSVRDASSKLRDFVNHFSICRLVMEQNKIRCKSESVFLRTSKAERGMTASPVALNGRADKMIPFFQT